MNRFFSKLDLRDIKIDPRNTSFPPDADDADAAEVAEAVAEAESPAVAAFDPVPTAAATAAPSRQPYAPAWKTGTAEPTAAGESNGAAHADAHADEHDHGHEHGHEPDHDHDGMDGDVERLPQRNGEVLKVSARSRPSAVAGAIAGVVRESGRAEVQAIGAGATNQAVKAVAIARDYLRETGIEAICLPAFIDVTIENEDRTAIRLVVEPR